MKSQKCLSVVRSSEGWSSEVLSSRQLIKLRTYSDCCDTSPVPKATAGEVLKVDRDARGLGRSPGRCGYREHSGVCETGDIEL